MAMLRPPPGLPPSGPGVLLFMTYINNSMIIIELPATSTVIVFINDPPLPGQLPIDENNQGGYNHPPWEESY